MLQGNDYKKILVNYTLCSLITLTQIKVKLHTKQINTIFQFFKKLPVDINGQNIARSTENKIIFDPIILIELTL